MVAELVNKKADIALGSLRFHHHNDDDEDDEDDDDREHLEAGHKVHVWYVAAHLPWASYHCSAHSRAEEKKKKISAWSETQSP